MGLGKIRSHVIALAWLAVTVAATPGAAAQELYGSIVGTVQDGSGARIPGATITIVNRDNNLTMTAVSNESGAYTFTNVLPGPYDVKVSLQGFKEFVQQNVPVTTGSISRVEAKLEVGALTESVTVQSEVQLLKTDKADTGSAFSSKEIEELPLPEFRNYQSLLDLVPGSTPSEFQNAEIDTPARALSTTVNGTNRNNNSTRVDGATNSFTWLPHHALYVAPAETIASVNVTTGSFSADQGLAGGAAVTVITKSGTNRLSGSGFAFYTDQNLRARTWSAKRNNTPKLPSDHHIDGGTLGGPIVRNKVFYFGAFEGQYRNTAGESINDVPTEKMRRGDFSEALNSNGSLQLIYDPRTGDSEGRGRVPFANNIIPADRINAVARRIKEFYPLPNGPGNSGQLFQGVHQHVRPQPVPTSRSTGTAAPAIRSGERSGSWTPRVSNLQKLSFDGGGLGKTKTWVGDDRADLHAQPVTRHRHHRRVFAARSVGVRSGLRHQLRTAARHPGHQRPRHPPERHAGLGERHDARRARRDSWNPYTRFDPTYTATANVTKLAGTHSFRFGGAIDHQSMNHWQPEFGGAGPRGRFNFSGNLTGLRSGPQSPNFYNQYATFLLGMTSQVQKAIQWEEMSTREMRYGFYFGDRWQAHPDVTLDLGVRYEYFPLVTRADGRGVERLDIATMEVLLGGVGDIPRNVGLKTRKTDFAPRRGRGLASQPADGGALGLRSHLQPAAVRASAARRLSAHHPQHLRQPEQLAAVRHARAGHSGIHRPGPG